MPPVVRRLDTHFTPTVWTRFVARLQERDPKTQPYMTESANGESACYFGEYVMSFAASVGNLRICQKIKRFFPTYLPNYLPTYLPTYRST